MPVCTDCGGTVIEYDQAAGNGFCVGCGTVVEENTIVNEIGFGETAGGAAIVQGSFVGQGATHARMSGPYGNRGSNESREQTIANANKKIQSIANVLKLSEVVCLAATRMYTLAVEHKFTKGRKSMNVVAVCLYVACRQKETRNYMLIDFSDLLQVNVFELGHTYLQLVQTLNLRLPLVDPSHYISRFAALLEFGDETHRVATDAVRLVQRFDRDWMTRGRRPAGICGAALLLAARMNNFRRSVEEIVQVVKIADTTLKKRLDEFKATPSGQLTLADFRNVWLDEEMDPPAFTRGKEREEAERLAALEAENGGEEGEEGQGEAVKSKGKGKGKNKKGEKKRKGKRKRREETEEEEEEVAEAAENNSIRQALDPSVLGESILADVIDLSAPMSGGDPVDDSNIDPALLEQSRLPQTQPSASASSSSSSLPPAQTQTQVQAPILPPSQSPTQTGTITVAPTPKEPLFIPSPSSSPRATPEPGPTPTPTPGMDEMTLVDETTSNILAEEVSVFLHKPEGSRLAEALDEAEHRRLAQIEERRRAAIVAREQRESGGGGGVGGGSDDTPNAVAVDEDDEENALLGLNEEELDRFILNEDEVRIKERVWVELNKDYLEAIAAKGDQDGSTTSRSKKRRKTNNKPRDASSAAGDTAAESVRNLIKKNPKYSKRINYDALKDLFVDGSAGGARASPSGSGPSSSSAFGSGNGVRGFGSGTGRALGGGRGGGGGTGTVVTRDDDYEDGKDEADLYTMDLDDKTDEVILEEESVVLRPVDMDEGGLDVDGGKKRKKKGGLEALERRMGMGVSEDEDDEDEDDDKEGDVSWLDVYEQEV